MCRYCKRKRCRRSCNYWLDSCNPYQNYYDVKCCKKKKRCCSNRYSCITPLPIVATSAYGPYGPCGNFGCGPYDPYCNRGIWPWRY